MEEDSHVFISDKSKERLSINTWVRMNHVSLKMTHAITEHLRQWDLSLAHFDVLVHVHEAEGLMQQELARRLLVTEGNVCYLVDKLEQRQLLIRKSEGRFKHLFLSTQGRQLLDDLLPIHRGVVTELFASLSPEEHAALLSALRVLDKALD
jgi:MarR family 2-MHQ and catechol resistance regulon transcriptional repressor